MERDAVRRPPSGRSEPHRGRSVSLPPRADNLDVRDVGDDVVVLNLDTQEAHCLSGVAAEVFRAAGSRRSIRASRQDVEAAVGGLIQARLMTPPEGFTRRAMLQRAGMVV